MNYLSSVEFYNTNIDNEYKNVYDDVNFIEYFSAILSLDFADNTKGFNINTETSITIDVTSITDIEKINYCRVNINNGDAIRYYFVGSKDYNNSSSSVTLYLSLDFWHSYLKEIREANTKQFCLRRSYSGLTYTGSGYLYNNYVTDEEEEITDTYLTTYTTDINDSNIPIKKISFGEEEYKICYIKFSLAREALSVINSNRNINYENSFVHTCEPLLIFYAPYLLYFRGKSMSETTGFELETECLYNANGTYTSLLNTTFVSPYNFKNMFEKIEPYCLSKELVFNVPFPQIISVDRTSYIPKVTLENYVYACTVGALNYPFIAFAQSASIINSGTEYILDGINENSKIDFISVYDLGYYIDENNIPSPFNNDWYSKGTTEPRIHYYPYRYISLRIGDKNIPMIPPINSNSLWVYNNVNIFAKPYINWYFSDDFATVKRYPPLYHYPQTKQIPIAKESLTQYLINNGATESTNREINKVSSEITLMGNAFTLAGSIASKNPIGMGIGATGIINTLYNKTAKEQLMDARLADAEHSVDNITLPQNDGYIMPEVQDNAVYIGYLVTKQNYLEKVIDNFQRYGINFNNYYDILKNDRIFFDYVMTHNCDINLPNKEATNKVRAILNNGVRIWHTYDISSLTNYQGDYVDVVSNFDLNSINNMPTILASYYLFD